MNKNSRNLQQKPNPRKRRSNIHIADLPETNPADGTSLYEVPISYQATNDIPECSKRGHPIIKLKPKHQKKAQHNNTITSGKQKIVAMQSNSGYDYLDESNLYDVDLATSSEYKKMRKSLYDNKKGISREYIDMYDPTYICDSCQAMLWYGEAIRGNADLKKKSYSLCCSRGKVQLPKLKEPPNMLLQLFHGKNPQSKDFIEHIRQYNMMFSFTSMGGKIDHTYNKGGGPYNFRMHGQNYHTIGSLLPETGQKPKFSQLYIFDTDNEVSHRFSAYSDSSEKKGSITDPNSIPFLTVHQLKGMLDITNPLVKQFRMARDRISVNNGETVKLILVGRRGKDGRTYNLPTTNEVAALIIGDINGSGDKRDIILETKTGSLQRINELHPSYLALQYPLLFPFAEDGYRIDIPLRDVEDLNGPGRTRLSMRAFIAYRIQQRHQEESLILMSRKLLQQFLVDTYTMVENDRLYYIKCNQKKLRVADEHTICKAAESGKNDASKMGTRIFLPSSFTGGARYMQQNYMDAMALCNNLGYPDLFITFTCNPKWPEICRFLEKHGLKSEDRPDIITRMFKMKLDHLIKNIEDEHVLGKVSGVVYTVEFQKRGLPHAHICLFFEEPDKLRNPEDIDRIISAEIPDEEVDRELHHLVTEFMMHGPCGKDNPKNPCMKEKKCSKRFPREYTDATHVDDKGFPVYRRRNTGITKSGTNLDNRFVVGYNPKLLKQYQGHMNIEWCNKLGAIKYLFKYINKGPDRITVGFPKKKQQSYKENQTQNDVDEVAGYYDCRYISACEASWRLFAYDIHYQKPPVQRLSFHIKNRKPIVFDQHDQIADVVTKHTVKDSQFLKWMECNKNDEEARSLTYAKFPTKYTWNAKDKKWTRRTQGSSIGRINYVSPKHGETYYLRMLLNKIKGPTCYKDLKTVHGKVYKTYKETCYALGLLDGDEEYIQSIKETSTWATGSFCRSLFVMLITSDSLSRPEYVWDKTYDNLTEDILAIRRKELNEPDLELDPEAIKHIALAKIENMLLASGMSLKDIPNMPCPDFRYIDMACNMLIQDELNYDKQKLDIEHQALHASLTPEQRQVYDTIMDAVQADSGGLFFLYGYGGTGKTFVWKTLSTAVRRKGNIVLNVASSGIAALLLPGGRTAHSRFAIPLNPTEDSFCNISAESPLADLIREARLIIWDEAPLMHKHCFEALDRTIKDIIGGSNLNKPFGGKVVVFGGDFRQILPVIAAGNREEIVNASLNHSFLWDNCKVLKLTKNMRLQSGQTDQDKEEIKQFADWILTVGEGTAGDPNDGTTEIEFPEDVLLRSEKNHVDSIVSTIYPSITEHLNEKGYFEDKAILVPTNEEVDTINEYVLSKIKSDEHTYFSSDSVCQSEFIDEFEQSLYAPEILNGFKVSGIPNHKLVLKEGVPVMLLRNIDHRNGLCNGTRLRITRLGKHVIEAEVISGNNIGYKTYIPRMKLIPSDQRIPFKFHRRQFPLVVSFAMTINKSQGQSLSTVGLYLQRPVFTHGQLYVAISRVKSKKGLKVLICDKDGKPKNTTTNVVYKEVLQKMNDDTFF